MSAKVKYSYRGLRLAPWPDFKGQPIFEGDTVLHPRTGEWGVVLYDHPIYRGWPAWWIGYQDGTYCPLSLQVGDKGRAVVANGWPLEAVRSTILRGVVGSTAHGLNIEGQDDLDEMAVCLPSSSYVLGLNPPSHFVYRDAAEGERSQPGDLDLTIYTLRRYVHLLLDKGNPTCQILLWLPHHQLTTVTPLGEELRRRREGFICQRLGKAFLGYLRNQRERLAGERGQRNVTRPELIDKYGYDVKYASHLLRLGFQGIEMARERRLTLPMTDLPRDYIIGVRRGRYGLKSVLRTADELERELEKLIPTMPPEPDKEIEKWMIEAHLGQWVRRN